MATGSWDHSYFQKISLTGTVENMRGTSKKLGRAVTILDSDLITASRRLEIVGILECSVGLKKVALAPAVR